MEQIKEAVYLINDERYLHLRENGAGVGFATYNKVTGEPLESGQISEKNLPPDGQNTIPAASYHIITPFYIKKKCCTGIVQCSTALILFLIPYYLDSRTAHQHTPGTGNIQAGSGFPARWLLNRRIPPIGG